MPLPRKCEGTIAHPSPSWQSILVVPQTVGKAQAIPHVCPYIRVPDGQTDQYTPLAREGMLHSGELQGLCCVDSSEVVRCGKNRIITKTNSPL